MNMEVAGFSTSINPANDLAETLRKLKEQLATKGISAVMTKKVEKEEVNPFAFEAVETIPEVQNDFVSGIDMEEAIPQFGVPAYPTTEIETLDVNIPEQSVSQAPETVVPVDFDPLENTLSLSLNDFAQEENYDKHIR